MVSPLKTDKIPAQTTKQSNPTDLRVAGESPRSPAPEANARGLTTPDDSVEVSSAGRLYSEAAGKTGRSIVSITSQEQATGLAALIRQQFEEGGLQSLRAQAAIQPDHAATLLEASGG